MRRSAWIRILAIVLVISMLAAPVSAAGVGADAKGTNGGVLSGLIGLIRDIIRDIIGDLIPGPGEPQPTEPIETTEPTQPTEPVETTAPTEPVETEPVETEPEETEPEETEPEETIPETVLNLVEGYTNTENGFLLRGTTYTLSTLVAQEEQPAVAPYALRSSGVSTMSLSNAVALAAEETTVSDTALVIGSDGVIPNGRYVIYCDVDYAYAGNHGAYLTNSKTSDTPWNTTTLLGTDDKASATYFTFNRQSDGTYTIQGPAGNYLQITRNGSAIESAVRYFSVEVKDNGIWLRDNTSGDCINALGAPSNPLTDGNRNYTGKYFGGWTDGSPLKLYAVTTGTEPEEPEESETKVVYFPVTMFNYNAETIEGMTNINDITHALDMADEPNAETWNGFYFNDGNPSDPSEKTYAAQTGTQETTRYTVTYELVPYANIGDLSDDDQFVLISKNGSQAVIDNSTETKLDRTASISGAGNATLTYSYNANDAATEIGGASLWNYTTYETGSWLWSETHNCVKNTSGNYLSIGSGNGFTTEDETEVNIVAFSADANCVMLQCGSFYLNRYSGDNGSTFGGYSSSTDSGSAFYIYKKGTTTQETVTAPVTTNTSKEYARWNFWGYNTGDGGNAYQNSMYTGLVQNKLVDDKIVFSVNEPGIFEFDPSDPSVTDDGTKKIYQYVGLPFEKNAKGYYTFDSDVNGVYFPNGVGAAGTKPTEDNEGIYKLTFDQDNPQGWSGMSSQFGDKSTNLWAPYNTNANDTGAGNIDYHFGMRADIPFSMTSNGRLKSNDDASDPITFSFQGDDDVWIFINDTLVIDLGGIHNRLGATIDFAANTIEYYIPASNGKDIALDCYNDEDFQFTQKLFNEGGETGVLGMTRQEFAASDENHTMKVFYLERGKGTSNCKIEFNLPMRDSVLVTKKAETSWSASTGTESELTAQEKAVIDTHNFGFTLYKKTADSDEFIPVTNTRYYLLNADGTLNSTPSTDADGKFTLRNGQSAKFMTDMPEEGVTYYVVEEIPADLVKGYTTPDYNYAGQALNGFDYVGGHVANAGLIPEHELAMDATVYKSYELTAFGSIESIDTLEFICVNYMDKDMPNPSAFAVEDIIVLDYGLPVQIDPLANDLFRGDEIEIVHFELGDVDLDANGDGEISKEEGNALTSTPATVDGRSGTFTFLPEDYSITLNEKGEITSTVRDTFTYTMDKQLTEVEVLTYLIKVTGGVVQDATGTVDTDYTYGVGKLYIAPATIMYYEENFTDLVKFTNASGVFTPELKTESQYISAYQEPGVAGDENDSTYGSDLAYRGDAEHLADSHDSNGTSYFFDTTNGYVRFQYTFTGTGTSFFARTSAKTGYMQVLLFEGALEDATQHRGEQMDTWYRDTYWNDTNGYADDADGTLYNIPVFTESDLEYGTYTMLVTVAAAGTQGAGPNLTSSGNEFYLDGIRIMQPLNEDAALSDKALQAYNDDGEANLDVVTLRQKLITDAEEGEAIWDGENFVVLTDTEGDITTAEEYTSIGPKEEVYLAPGQKVRFSLKYWQPEGLNLYIGMKAPFGSAALNVGSTAYSLRNAADCYYDVTGSYASLMELTDEEGYPYYVVTYTFEATDKIVSLTNIKVVGNYEFTIIEESDLEVDGDVNEG